MASSGILYEYTGVLGLNPDYLRVWYNFNQTGGYVQNQTQFTIHSGLLASTGSFFTNGSGNFSNNRVAIQNPTGLTGVAFTHIFVNDKSKGAGILFDSFISGTIYSGYQIGINDNNKFYFEFYDDSGPAVYTSNLMYGKRNCSAVTFSNSLVTFYNLDFNNDKLESDSHSINSQFLLPSYKANLGGTGAGIPNYINPKNYSGLLDEYIYLNTELTPTNLKGLMSGFITDYIYTSGVVSGYSTIETTGYQTFITGNTGVLRSGQVLTASGIDNCGRAFKTFSGFSQTGYFNSGLSVVNLTGLVTYYDTGDGSYISTINTSFLQSFGLDEFSYLRKIDDRDISEAILISGFNAGLNRKADVDLVFNYFELDDTYTDNQVQIFLNGIAQINTGYSISNDIYNPQIYISGDYYLDGFTVNSTGFYDYNDYLYYDVISGQKQLSASNYPNSGDVIPLVLTFNNTVLPFLNGQLLISGAQYKISGSNFIWQTSDYNTESGMYVKFFQPPIANFYTGEFITGHSFQRRTSMLYLNGQRQVLDLDYLENSSIDLIGQSGQYLDVLEDLYLDSADYFE